MGPRVWSPGARRLIIVSWSLFVVAAMGLGWHLLRRAQGHDVVGLVPVLGLPASMISAGAAVLGVAAALFGWGTRPRADDPAVLASRARKVLGEVISAEERSLQLLLGDVGIPRPADVGFAQPEAASLRWRTDGGADSGTLATIADYYRDLTRGRLVVLGEGGAGKTVLVTRLLIDLAVTAQTVADADPTARIQVPVRLSLPTFPHEPDPRPERIRARLDTWIADRVAAAYGVEPVVATLLVADGWMLPLLEGLDEMDPDESEPIRASTVLVALNLPAGTRRWPVVLTCRTRTYERLACPGANAPSVVMQDATVVTLGPLEVEQVVAWLAHRFPDPSQPDGVHPRWRPVIARIRRNPTGRLASCLTSPLQLYLAVSTYQSPTSRPAELCDLDAASLEDHLFARLIPAITEHHTLPDGSRYAPDDVRGWLRTLADHLAWMGRNDHSGVDLHLQELWRSTGNSTHPGQLVRTIAATVVTGQCALLTVGISAAKALTTDLPRSVSAIDWPRSPSPPF